MRLIAAIFVLFLMCSTPNLEEKSLPRQPESVKPRGELLQRMLLTEKRLQSHPFSLEFIVQDVARVKGHDRRFEEYEGDISGRVLGAWSYAARLLGQRPVLLDSVAEAVLQYQRKEGYFGKNQQLEGWDMWGRQLWGHGRLLVGLVEYYKLTGDQRFLNSAEALGHYIASGIPQWPIEHLSHHWFTNYTSLLESLMILYEASGKQEFLEAGKRIVPHIPDFGYYHSHGYLISLVGLAKLYQHTGISSYWQRLYDIYWRDLMRFGQRPDGAICEWFPVDDRTEGCSIVDWLRLNLHMWQISKDAHYLDEAERTWLNALNFHQTHNGAFGHGTLTSCGYTAKYSEAWWCCLEHGLFGYSELLNHVVVAQDDSLWINFFTPLQANIEIQNQPCTLKIETGYPQEGVVDIIVTKSPAKNFKMNVRIPLWATEVKITLNGSPINAQIKDEYISLKRQWVSGDSIHIVFPIKLRLEDDRGNLLKAKSSADHQFHSGYFFYGSLLLGVDNYYNQKFPVEIFYNPSKKYQNVSNAYKRYQYRFALPAAHFTLPAQVGHKKMDIVLVPICEQTGYGTWSDRLPNFIRTGEKPIERYPVRICNPVKIINGR